MEAPRPPPASERDEEGGAAAARRAPAGGGDRAAEPRPCLPRRTLRPRGFRGGSPIRALGASARPPPAQQLRIA